ncbi:Uncharacterised protein [Xylophilus ampelinus]|nr:ATP-dependent DNA helicase [Variovorax sp.]VTY38525.1 Uncharacterised protein [Xylophilus ampelinus]
MYSRAVTDSDTAEARPSALLPVSVRALCAFAARAGDLDLRFTPAPSGLEGAEGHRRVQARRGPGYESEIGLRLECHGLLLRGRADGFDAEAGRLEEIKTHRGPIARVRTNQRALHWAQAKVYGAMLCADRGLDALEIALVYLELDSDEETPVEARFGADELQAHVEALCRRYAEWARQERERRTALDDALVQLAFPQARFRDGQRRFAAGVYQAVRDGRPLLAQAPTGIGKTLAALFPALKARPGARIDKIFYLTAKTPGRTVALEALERLHPGAPALRVLALESRERACMHPGRACHGDACPLAKGFFDRLPAARAAAAEARWLDAPALARIAADAQVCPYYLSQEMVRWADVVVADYNHWFDPHALLFALAQDEEWRVALLVDEAHNLLERGRAMYSGALDGAALGRAVAMAPRAVAGPLRAVQREWAAAGRATRPEDAASRFRTQVPDGLTQAVRQSVVALTEHLAQDPAAADGPLHASFFELLQLDRLIEDFDRDFLLEVAGEADDGCLAVRNLVPATPLRGRWAAAHAGVAFSATFAPFEFYRDTLGLPARTATLDVPSPFGPEQLELHIADGLSGRARHRTRALPQLVRAVVERCRERPGNHLVFLGSLDYVAAFSVALARAQPGLPVWTQTPAMDAGARRAFIDRFAPGGHGVGVAVLGGAFGEGVDLPGDRLVGVFIAGLGLPPHDAFNEQVRQRMDARFGAGYDYTYLYPGLQKVAQAAGRVIRTETDRGALFLLDDRFRDPAVQALLPAWWAVERALPAPVQAAPAT